MFSSKQERSGAELLPNSGEALAERVDMLASTVSSAAASFARTDGEIAVLRRELGNGLARIEELAGEVRSRARASDVRELEKKVGAFDFERTRSSHPKRLDDLASKIDVLAERVDTLGTTVATTAASVAGRDGEVAALRRIFDGKPTAPAVDETLRRRVEDVAAASASASLRLEAHGDEIQALAGSVEALDARLSQLVERLDAVERERTALASSVADAAAARWLDVDRSLAALAKRLDACEERASAVSAELGRATSLWPAALRSLESRVDGLAGVASREGETGAPQPAADMHVLAALRTLEQRVRGADAAAREERELVLERLDDLAGRLDERLEPVRHEAEIVPFRADP